MPEELQALDEADARHMIWEADGAFRSAWGCLRFKMNLFIQLFFHVFPFICHIYIFLVLALLKGLWDVFYFLFMGVLKQIQVQLSPSFALIQTKPLKVKPPLALFFIKTKKTKSSVFFCLKRN